MSTVSVLIDSEHMRNMFSENLDKSNTPQQLRQDFLHNLETTPLNGLFEFNSEVLPYLLESTMYYEMQSRNTLQRGKQYIPSDPHASMAKKMLLSQAEEVYNSISDHYDILRKLHKQSINTHVH